MTGSLEEMTLFSKATSIPSLGLSKDNWAGLENPSLAERITEYSVEVLLHILIKGSLTFKRAEQFTS